MAESSTLVSLPQLVDIALNAPEPGVVNFHALHTLLHVLIQQIAVSDVAVEFRGPDSERMQSLITATKPTTTTTPFSQYAIIGGKRRRSKKSVSLQDIKEHLAAEDKKEQELRTIEQRKDSKADPAPNPTPLRSPPVSASPSFQNLRTVVVVDSSSKLPQFSVAVTKEHFNELENEVNNLKNQIKELLEMPANMGLIEATRTSSSPILDMFQILNLVKRMDATEMGIEKLISLIEELTKQLDLPPDSKLLEHAEVLRTSVASNKSHSELYTALEERVDKLEKALASGNFVLSEESNQGEEKKVIDNEGKESASTKEDTTTNRDVMRKFSSATEGKDLSEMSVSDALDAIQKDLTNIKDWINNNPHEKFFLNEINKIKEQLGGGEGAGGVDSKAIDSKLSEYAKQTKELDDVYNNQIGNLQDQLTQLQKEFGQVATKLEIILPGGDSVAINAETTMELSNKLGLLEQEIITISEAADKMKTEKEALEKSVEAVLEQIDVLKIVKANREDLEEALGDKADACMINRKVSHDQFDAACDDLSRGIEEALTKLQEQEKLWHQALDSLQKDVGNKLDKNEVDPLRDFVNNKLKALQEKFKALTALKREQEAAGTKTKLLKDVNCISCDKDVVMKREVDSTMKPKPYAMPPNRNMAPYLAYELDQLRKQQKCVPGSKNLNFFESALKTRGQREKDHVCNRYCGGSHTLTTPQQRVTRTGHFLQQWGPEIAPLNDEYIRGVDNHMYKARDDGVKKDDKQAAAAPAVPSAATDEFEPAVKESDIPQTEQRDTLVSDSIQNMMSKQAGKVKGGKFHSIGSTGKYTEKPPEIREMSVGENADPKVSKTKVTESRLSESQNKVSKTKLSETDKPRLSQSRSQEKQSRLSQEIQQTEQRGSQFKPIEHRGSPIPRPPRGSGTTSDTLQLTRPDPEAASAEKEPSGEAPQSTSKQVKITESKSSK